MTRKTLYADDVKAAIEKLKPTQEDRNRWIAWIGHPGPCDYKEDAIKAALVAIDSLPAAEPDAGERVARPPMLLAQFRDGGRWAWMQRFIPRTDIGPWAMICDTNDPDILWHSKSEELFAVDRTASDEAALKLYDQDLAASRPATP